MSIAQLIYLAVLGTAVFFIVMLMLAPALIGPSKEQQRLMEVLHTQRTERRGAQRLEQFEDGLAAVVRNLRARLGLTTSERAIRRLAMAGYRSAIAPDIFFAISWAVPVLGLLAGSFIEKNTIFCCAAFAGVGYILPNFWITQAIERRKARIRRGLPEVMDLLVICVDAGLGLDQALMRVGEELHESYSELQEELQRVLLEQKAGKPRLEAWRSLAERTEIQELGTFVSMLTQTDRFGTPIARALSQFSDDLRLKRKQRAEEAAAKMKVKIVFPLVFCIFPCLFLVLLAPAILGIFSSFASLSK